MVPNHHARWTRAVEGLADKARATDVPSLPVVVNQNHFPVAVLVCAADERPRLFSPKANHLSVFADKVL